MRSVFSHFLLKFLPAALIFGGVAFYEGEEIIKSRLEAQEIPMREAFARASEAAESTFSLALLHIKSITTKDAIIQMALKGDTAHAISAIEPEFKQLLERNPNYYKVRWIGENGVELLRLDQDAPDNIKRVPDSALQDKSARPYVTETLALPRGEVYVSPLDLDVENGEVQKPYVPTMRVAAHVFDGEIPKGLFIINLRASMQLDKFAHLTQGQDIGWLNGDGYWLGGGNPVDQWAFMFGNNDSTLAVREPEVWAAIQAAPDGNLVTSNGLWTWLRVHPHPEKTHAVQGAPFDWIMLGHISAEDRDALVMDTREKVLGIVSVLLGLLGVAAWQLVRNTQLRIQREQEVLAHAAMLESTNQQLQESTRCAEQASLAKSQFLATMSHEIRTPINAIISMTHLLDQEPLSEVQHQQVSTIKTASDVLLGLVNDVLDLSKIEAGQMLLERAPFQMATLLADLRQMFASQAEQKHLVLDIAPIPADLPATLYGDDQRLRQMCLNLLSNALKFTACGSVRLVCEVLRQDADTHRLVLRVSVIDTGIGVPADRQSGLFQPFTQADMSDTRRYGGTGLGLSIIRELSQQMGGQAGFSSVEGVGSTFWFEVSLETNVGEAIAEDIDPQHQATLPGLHILLADDNPHEQQVLQKFAAHWGWQYRAVTQAADIVEQVLTAQQNGTPFDCLVFNGRFVTESQDSFLQQILTSLGNEALPVVVLTQPQDWAFWQQSAATQSVNHILVQPVTLDKLFNAVNTAMVAQGFAFNYVVQHSIMDKDAYLWLDGVKVMAIDDSETNLLVLKMLLQKQGAQTSCYLSAADALEVLHRGEVPDVLLMDLQMPDMDGMEATVIIRKSLGLKDLPIIAVTAATLLSDRENAMDAGMNDFMSKPVNPQQLIRTIRRYVEMRRDRPVDLTVRPAEMG